MLNSDSVSGVTLTSTGATATATVAGSPYAIVASNATGSGLNNYIITYVNGSLTVNRALLTITADNASKTYGQTLTFNGTQFTTSGLLNSNSVSSVTMTSAGAAAAATVAGSPYAIAASAAKGVGLSNYSITYITGALTVNQAILTITADNINKIYGQTFTFNGAEFTTSGLVNGNSVGSVTFTSAGTAAVATVAGSPYPIEVSDATSTDLNNYIISYVKGILSVSAATLTVSVNDATKVEGLSNPNFTDSIAGFVNGDATTVVTGAPSLATTAVVSSPTGVYPITAGPGTLSAANYTFAFVNGTLTVTGTVSNDPPTVGGGNDLPPISNGTSLGSAPPSPSGSTTNSAPIVAVTIPIYTVPSVTSSSSGGSSRTGSGIALPPLRPSPIDSNDVAVASGNTPLVRTTTSSQMAAAAPISPVKAENAAPQFDTGAGTRAALSSTPDVRTSQPAMTSSVSSLTAADVEAADSVFAQLDRAADAIASDADEQALTNTLAVSSGVAVAGYMMLNTRSIYWFLSAFLARPAVWRRFDPLEVIYAWERERVDVMKRHEEPKDEESLLSMVK